MKRCSKCHKLLPESEFYRDKRKTDGLTSQCKHCHCQTTIKTRNPDKARESNKQYMRRAISKDPEKFRIQWKKYNRKKDKKVYARMILNDAIRDGKIIKPDQCEECGRKLKLTAHHDNYDEPLKVKWLCYECHAKHHRKVS